jgi:hypothetical protein
MPHLPRKAAGAGRRHQRSDGGSRAGAHRRGPGRSRHPGVRRAGRPGFQRQPSDLKFILAQIKIAEHHAASFNAQDPCAGLIGAGPNQIPEGGNAVELPWGLRTVDGTCNNLLPAQSKFGAADQRFPRRVSQPTLKGAEPVTFDTDGPGPEAVGGSTSYQQTSGSVFDSQPRVISNLIVDQTAANPAAIAAAGPGAVADPATGTLPIPNNAPDVGLSAPYNSVFIFFGQFFDHGLDLVAKGGNGTVYMPLKEDDPLYQAGSHTNFMAVSRATMVPGTHEATNLTTPFVDQNQTYSSHPAHQVFLREYVLDTAGKPRRRPARRSPATRGRPCAGSRRSTAARRSPPTRSRCSTPRTGGWVRCCRQRRRRRR